ncbi:MAG: hypothetical protein ACRC8S_03625 [Fimbriiglobus sp.]
MELEQGFSAPMVTSSSAKEQEITLEEWIAATQACCGVDHDNHPTQTQDGVAIEGSPDPISGQDGEHLANQG